MRETPAQFNEALATQRKTSASLHLRPTSARTKDAYPIDPLGKYRYHTGTQPKPLSPDEDCPVLFRDIGSVAMANFLRGELTRLAGPYIPITYLRTEAYQEPYEDYAKIGRLVLLRPLEVHPWHSGIPHIYIARASRMTGPETLGYVPGNVSLEEASQCLAEAPNTAALREAFGGKCYDEQRRDAAHMLDKLNHTLARTEQLALPLRRLLQSSHSDDNKRAREYMARVDIDESDLCAAWHHIPDARRLQLEDAFLRFAAMAGEA